MHIRIRDRMIKGTALNLIAVAFSQGSTLIANILVARILLKQGFGEYAMVQSTLLMASSLSQLATGYTATKYIAEYRSGDPERAGRIMGLCSLVSALMAGVVSFLLIVASPWLATTVLKAPHLAVALMIGSGFLFFFSINGYQMGALSGLEAYGSLAKAGVASGIIAVVAISLGAWWSGLNGAMTGLSISALVRCAIHNKRLLHESRMRGIKPRYRGSLKHEKAIIFRFALPAALAGYYSTPMIWLANSFLVRQPGGYEEMALYSAANNLRILVLFLPNIINSVGLSLLNSEKAKEDKAHYHKLFKSNVSYIFFISIIGVILVGVSGRQLLQLFGKDFGNDNLLLWLLLVSAIFESLSIALYQYMQSNAFIWLGVFYINVPREFFFVVSAYFFVQFYGGVGLAFSYMGSIFLGFILHFSLVVFLYRKERVSV